MECSCTINGCCDEGYEESENKIETFNSNLLILRCGECHRKIKQDEKYEWYRGKYDGESHTHCTCLDCLSFRDSFFFDWAFESLWDDFICHMDECDWEVPEKCISKCTPATMVKICNMIENHWETL